MRKFITAMLVALLIPVANLYPASAYNQRVKADSPTWQPLSRNIQVWILGKQVNVFKCVAKSSSSTLSLGATANNLSEVVPGTVSLDANLCPTHALPYAARYVFTPTFAGKDFPGTQAKRLVYQITVDNGTPVYAIAAVYPDTGELNADEVDGKLPGIISSDEGDPHPQALDKPVKSSVQPKASATPLTLAALSARATSGWNGCSFNGVPMFGRVRYVPSGAQFKIRVVTSGAAIRVSDPSPRAPKKCGEWQFVQVKAKFTVQIVKSGGDFTVSLGTARPGLNN
jgi:hypothetical protein